MKLQVVKGVGSLAAAGTILAVLGQTVQAADPQSGTRVRVAAIGDAAAPRQAAQRDAASARDLWQLVQNTTAEDQGSPVTTEHRATILAAFHASAPESTEEELAKQHGLEIVRRLTLSSLDLRVVTYKLRDGSVSEIVERLRTDPRVSSAQANVAYRSIDPDEAKVSRSEPPRDAVKQPAQAPKRAPTRSASANVERQPPVPKATSEHVPMRGGLVTATAADVLAGGL
jgi:hypothetical protein